MAKKGRRNTFTEADKEEAVRLLVVDGWTLAQVAEYCKCSIASLQKWKAEYAEWVTQTAVPADEPTFSAPVVTSPTVEVPICKTAKKQPVNDMVQDFWRRDNRAADILFKTDAERAEIMKLVEDALVYAQQK